MLGYVGIVLLGIVIVFAIYSLLMYWQTDFRVLALEQNIANTEGQINALLAKYGMAWEEISGELL